MSVTLVISPGFGNSDAPHWQSVIERKYSDVIRVQQRDWFKPELKAWSAAVEQAVRQAPSSQVVLVGHSCGSVAITQWAQHYASSRILGALLVAPADVDASDVMPELIAQRPMVERALPFPSVVVCSDNDPHMSVKRSHYFAQRWGSTLITLSGAGHINAESGFGRWLLGEQLINRLKNGLLEP